MYIFTPNTLIESSKVNANFAELGGGYCQVILNAPANFTDTTQQTLGFTTITTSGGIISATAASETFSVSTDCIVSVLINLGIAHSATPDTFHIHSWKDGVDSGIVSTSTSPVSLTASNSWMFLLPMVTGSSYLFKIGANGASGTHTPDYTYSTNTMILTVVGQV